MLDMVSRVVFANVTCGAVGFRSDIRIAIPDASKIGISHNVAFFNKSPSSRYPTHNIARAMKKQKTALVLSAGGMFGAYQAGAWKILSEQLEIDMVVGASVGAVNGWSIAGGCSADELISNWRDPITGQALKLFDSRPLRVMAERLHGRYTPRIPYGLVVLELAGMNTRLVQHPEVGPEHIHAACSIPFVLPPVKIGGKRYVDGGVLAKLPVFAAVEMGATRVIAIDVLPDFGKWRTYPSDIDLTVLKPSVPLGGMKDLFYWKPDLVEQWIELGMRDAVKIGISRAA